MIEYSDHLHEHAVNPVVMRDGRYQLPAESGYGITIKPASLDQFEFPHGPAWRSKADSQGNPAGDFNGR